ncbi:MAG: hypothetical protein HQL76_08565 [Magnetococcales bacterium]|nr:hypothetical protein [Magnetococcales bacterium]
MAVAILVMGIMMTMGMGILRASLENMSLGVTRSRMDHIHEILVHHLRRNGRLPCPDVFDDGAYDGREDGAPGACTHASGVLPFAELGLDRKDVLDGWNQFFTYHVSNQTNPAANMAIRCPANHDWTANIPLREGFEGEVAINTVNCVVAVVVSHGPNGDGAFTVDGYRNATTDAGTDELENADDDWVFIDLGFGPNYDDLVLSFSSSDLLAPLIRDGTVFSEGRLQGQLEATFSRIQGALFSFAAGQLSNPAQCPGIDSWSPGVDYEDGHYVIPPAVHINGYYYQVVEGHGGTSVAEPAWSTDINKEEQESGGGTIVWKTVGPVALRNRYYPHNLPGAAMLPGSGNDDSVYAGYVPFLTLGLKEDDVNDPWGNPIRYFVNAVRARNTLETDGLYFGPGVDVSGKAFMLVSGGADGFDEANYVAGIGSECATDSFDQCESMSVAELLNRMTAAGIPVDTFIGCP